MSNNKQRLTTILIITIMIISMMAVGGLGVDNPQTTLTRTTTPNTPVSTATPSFPQQSISGVDPLLTRDFNLRAAQLKNQGYKPVETSTGTTYSKTGGPSYTINNDGSITRIITTNNVITNTQILSADGKTITTTTNNAQGIQLNEEKIEITQPTNSPNPVITTTKTIFTNGVGNAPTITHLINTGTPTSPVWKNLEGNLVVTPSTNTNGPIIYSTTTTNPVSGITLSKAIIQNNDGTTTSLSSSNTDLTGFNPETISSGYTKLPNGNLVLLSKDKDNNLIATNTGASPNGEFNIGPNNQIWVNGVLQNPPADGKIPPTPDFKNQPLLIMDANGNLLAKTMGTEENKGIVTSHSKITFDKDGKPVYEKIDNYDKDLTELLRTSEVNNKWKTAGDVDKHIFGENDNYVYNTKTGLVYEKNSDGTETLIGKFDGNTVAKGETKSASGAAGVGDEVMIFFNGKTNRYEHHNTRTGAIVIEGLGEIEPTHDIDGVLLDNKVGVDLNLKKECKECIGGYETKEVNVKNKVAFAATCTGTDGKQYSDCVVVKNKEKDCPKYVLNCMGSDKCKEVKCEGRVSSYLKSTLLGTAQVIDQSTAYGSTVSGVISLFNNGNAQSDYFASQELRDLAGIFSISGYIEAICRANTDESSPSTATSFSDGTIGLTLNAYRANFSKSNFSCTSNDDCNAFFIRNDTKCELSDDSPNFNYCVNKLTPSVKENFINGYVYKATLMIEPSSRVIKKDKNFTFYLTAEGGPSGVKNIDLYGDKNTSNDKISLKSGSSTLTLSKDKGIYILSTGRYEKICMNIEDTSVFTDEFKKQYDKIASGSKYCNDFTENADVGSLMSGPVQFLTFGIVKPASTPAYQTEQETSNQQTQTTPTTTPVTPYVTGDYIGLWG